LLHLEKISTITHIPLKTINSSAINLSQITTLDYLSAHLPYRLTTDNLSRRVLGHLIMAEIILASLNTVGLIFGGCCSNVSCRRCNWTRIRANPATKVFTLEKIIK
jgi:hypothetical protein